MKPIEVRDQVRLGPGRVLGLSISGMSYRMFRSMVTVAILGLAVAFLAHMISFGLIEQKTLSEVQGQLRENRLLGEWVTRLSRGDSVGEVEEALAGNQAGRLAEYRAWGGLSDAEFQRVRESAGRLKEVNEYLETLPATSQATLTAGLETRELLARLRRPEELAQFRRHMDELRLESPLGTVSAFEKLVTEEAPRVEKAARSIQEGQARAIGELRKAYPGRTATQLLGEQPEGLERELAAAGFALTEKELKGLAQHAREREKYEQVATVVNLPQTKYEIALQLGMSKTSVDAAHVLKMTYTKADAEQISAILAKNGGKGITAEGLLTLAEAERKLTRLQAAAGDRPLTSEAMYFGLPRWTAWLIGLSFLVCTVGVANAMFMSVTERFAEIATMKCLGALDGFLMVLFLFESGIQGVVGAAAGVVFGVSLAFLRVLWGYGTLISVPWLQLAAGCALCMVAGLVLAVLGGVGPAWAAARLAPMEAMRIE